MFEESCTSVPTCQRIGLWESLLGGHLGLGLTLLPLPVLLPTLPRNLQLKPPGSVGVSCSVKSDVTLDLVRSHAFEVRVVEFVQGADAGDVLRRNIGIEELGGPGSNE